MGGPHGLNPQRDRILSNDGAGNFIDVSERWGLNQIPPAFGLSDNHDQTLASNKDINNFTY